MSWLSELYLSKGHLSPATPVCSLYSPSASSFFLLDQLSAMSTIFGRHQVWGQMAELAPGICPHPSFLFVDSRCIPTNLGLGWLNSFPAEVSHREKEFPPSPVHSFTQKSHCMPSTGQRWSSWSFPLGETEPSLLDSRHNRRVPRKYPLEKGAA